MIPSLFSKSNGKKKAERPVFTEDDIRKLILTFPPPEPRPGKESLIRSLSGGSLVRSDAVVKRFRTLLENVSGYVYLNNLHNELGVHDVQWLLAQEDDHIFYTKDRQRLLSAGVQQRVIQQLRTELAQAGVDLNRHASDNNVTVATLRRIVAAQDANVVLEDLKDGRTYDTAYLEKTREELLDIVKKTTSTVNLDERFSQVPQDWLESTCHELVSTDGNSVHGIQEKDSSGLRFIPQSALQEQETELEQAQNAFVVKAVDELTTSGHFDISVNSQPEIMRKAKNLDLVQLIRKAYTDKVPKKELVKLESKDEDSSTHSHVFLVVQNTLDKLFGSLSSKASHLAEEQWQARDAGTEPSFSPTSFLKTSSHPELDLAILQSHDLSSHIQTSWNLKLSQLQRTTTQHFSKALQVDVLAPLTLYSTGASTIADEALRSRVQDFIYDWARRDLIPSFKLTVKDRNLITSKQTSKDLIKFADAIQSSKTLEEITTATTKLARKQKTESPSPNMLESCRHNILRQKATAMKKMKRGSDLLQNVTWILLAKSKGSLFMSSGKDTSRMVRLAREDEDEEVGEKLEAWREVIKKGEETDVERKEMRELAVRLVQEIAGAVE